jgi:hypothetical protein
MIARTAIAFELLLVGAGFQPARAAIAAFTMYREKADLSVGRAG